MAKIEGPVTRDAVRALAFGWAHDPATVVEIVHEGFDADVRSGGYAFLCDRGLLIHGFDGFSSWGVDPGDEGRRIAKVEQFWREARHRNRPLALSDVSEWHRAAIAALVAGHRSVAALAPSERAGVTDDSRADYLLVALRRQVAEHTEPAALRVLAANDWLLEVPDEHRRAHRCPLCGLPAIGERRRYVSVCDECYRKTVCSHDRPVTGSNTSLAGGFEAHHRDDGSVCEQVTNDGRVRIDGRACSMGEARFGGVFVAVEPGERSKGTGR